MDVKKCRENEIHHFLMNKYLYLSVFLGVITLLATQFDRNLVLELVVLTWMSCELSKLNERIKKLEPVEDPEKDWR